MTDDRRDPPYVPLAWALGLYLVWTAATWLLEGWPRTLRRPELVGMRLTYVAVANLGIGIAGTAWVVRRLTEGRPENLHAVGLARPTRTAFGIALGLLAGLAVFVAQPAPSREPMVVVNAYAQTLAVSTAEVLVCWVAVTAALRASGWFSTRWSLSVAGWLASAVLFGAYHYAHSPPFDTFGMVALLTVVGLATGAFYHLVREVWGTLAFHNFLAVVGVTQAVADAGRIESLRGPRPALYLTAGLAVVGLALVHRQLPKRA